MIWTQIELPSLHLLWKRKNREEIVSSAIRTNYPKPSLCYIPAIVQQTGVEVKAVDMKIQCQDVITPYREFSYGEGTMLASRMGMPFEMLEQKIRESDVIGISINPSSWSNMALDLIKFSKKIKPSVKVIIGGNEAIFRPEHYLIPGGADIAVMGEGETIIPDLVMALRGKKELKKVNGLAYRQEKNITLTNPADRSKMDDVPLPALDALVEDIPLWTTPIESWPLPQGAKKPIGWIFLSRGCYQSCDYCTSPKKMGRFRFKTLESIAKELEHNKKHGITTLNIWDDSIGSVLQPSALGRERGREYLIGIARMLKDNGFAYELSQGGIVIKDLWDTEKDEPDFELITEFFSNEVKNGKFVGFYGQYFPFECLQLENPHDRYTKLMTFEKEKEVLKAVISCGKIKPAISYSTIMGTLDDTSRGFALATRRLLELNGFVHSKKKRWKGNCLLPINFPNGILLGDMILFGHSISCYLSRTFPSITKLEGFPDSSPASII
ncbi:cobalamin B12-binding domain-containing protein [Candidatus Pacearchaeota archaeon]|nr:cobalamin B12-binding domain-containing protein [Candidatus Pacearchaeota archaeon]